MELKDRMIVVTGAGSGLGQATVEHLLGQGAKVLGLDIAHEVTLSDLSSNQYIATEADVTDEASIKKALKQASQKLGPCRGLVNCAGVVMGARVLGKSGPHDLAAFKRIIDINLIGTFNISRLVAAEMQQAEPLNDDGERGVIIHTASVAAFEGQIGQAAYSASKGAVAAMTLPMARELAAYGIRVMTIAPGIMQTPMMAGMTEALQASLVDAVVYPKRLGAAVEFANLVQHIFENPYLNGSIVRLDAGIRLN